jgi:hypothetical protein
MTAENEKTPEPKIAWNVKSVALLAVALSAVLLMILFAGGAADQMELNAWVNRSAKWKATDGQITALSTFTPRSTLQRRRFSWEPTVKYSYVVDGVPLSGNTIGKPGFSFTSEQETRAYLENFKVGNKVTVYYDPKMVWKSCLVKGARLTKETKIPQSK